MAQHCPNSSCQPCGGSRNVVKHGFFRVRNGRRRRYRFRACGQTFSKHTGTACYRLSCSRAGFDQVAMLSVEGLTRAAIARVESVNWKTIDRWLSRATSSARRFNQQEIKARCAH